MDLLRQLGNIVLRKPKYQPVRPDRLQKKRPKREVQRVVPSGVGGQRYNQFGCQRMRATFLRQGAHHPTHRRGLTRTIQQLSQEPANCNWQQALKHEWIISSSNHLASVWACALTTLLSQFWKSLVERLHHEVHQVLRLKRSQRDVDQGAVRVKTIVVDMVHPANSLFFHHPIKEWKKAGHDVVIASREKDVLIPLLDEFGFAHTKLTSAGTGLLGLGVELALRNYRLWRLARRVNADVLVGFGGVAPSHVGKITGIPSIAFYDTEWAALQNKITLPFIGEWHVPSTWQGPIAKGRTFNFPRAKQFAYLHPDYFKPSLAAAKAAGFEEGKDNFLVRVVAWNANHDQGRSGIGPERLMAMIEYLSQRGRVHLSTEADLPAQFEAWRFRGSPAQFHHLLAHCRACIGESITVASEAVILGVPAMVEIDKDTCYVTEQEERGLILRLSAEAEVDDGLDRLLALNLDAYKANAREFASAGDDLNKYIFDNVLRVAGGKKRG